MENIILLSRDDLKDAFREVIQEMNPNPDDELLTSQGLANYLGYSIDWVMRASSRVKRGLPQDFPPFHRRCRKLIFRKSQVDRWLEGRES